MMKWGNLMKRDLGSPEHKTGDNDRRDTEQVQEEYQKGCRGRLGDRKEQMKTKKFVKS